MDGTFNQTKPLDRLAGVSSTVYSVDLKSATDRWPLLLMFELMQTCFDRSFASSVVNSTLGTNIFEVPFVKKSNVWVSFIAGQPLGYYSSWPLFALSHHLVVWYASEKVRPGVVFKDYAILGDDVVIADTDVHDQYRKIIKGLGVNVSEGKCLTSPSGAAEFAMKFRLDKLNIDVSPISIRQLFEARSPMGWYNFHTTFNRKLRFSTCLRMAGIGFRAASRPYGCNKHKRRASRLSVMLTFARINSIHLSLMSVLGCCILPSVLGRLVFILLNHYRIKDPIVPPDDAFAYPGMKDFLEYSLFRGWMKQYLSYLKWICLLKMKSDISLDDFVDAPMYIEKSTLQLMCLFVLA